MNRIIMNQVKDKSGAITAIRKLKWKAYGRIIPFRIWCVNQSVLTYYNMSLIREETTTTKS